MDLKSQINLDKLPRHIAIIMDGNGRWAKQHGKPRVFGHRNGVKSVRETTEAAAELGIEYLTLYAFSTENWNRPQFEINALMTLLVETLSSRLSSGISMVAVPAMSPAPGAVCQPRAWRGFSWSVRWAWAVANSVASTASSMHLIVIMR